MRFYSSTRWLVLILAVSASIIGGAWPRSALAESALKLTFITHASFFSTETNQPQPLDPHAFVRDENVPAATGPQNIQHIAGFRPALLTDPPTSPVFTAQGKPLGFTLGKWLAAKGTVVLTPLATGGAKITARFTGLRPKGVYSLFENHFDQKPIGFTPLDDKGLKNSFVASAKGTASVTVTAPEALTHANAVLLVYHSDHLTHGTSRGDIGISAHHQLIARLP